MVAVRGWYYRTGDGQSSEVTVVELLNTLEVLVSMKEFRASPLSFNFLCSCPLRRFGDSESSSKNG
jgi:hypothetical protein